MSMVKYHPESLQSRDFLFFQGRYCGIEAIGNAREFGIAIDSEVADDAFPKACRWFGGTFGAAAFKGIAHQPGDWPDE